MKALIRFLFGIALVAGIVTFVRSPRGVELRNRLAGLVGEIRDLLRQQDLTEVAKGVAGPQSTPDEEAIRAKIDETRRRLQEQLDAQMTGARATPTGSSTS